VETKRLGRTGAGVVAARWDDLFQPFFQDIAGRTDRGAGGLVSPAVDVEEDAASLRITAELPGLDRRDIDLHVEDGVLVLRGEKPRGKDATEGRPIRVERRHGAFYRALTLPESADAGRIEATLRSGVLSIRVPKREARKPKGIAIKE
jgi:HSP20 family protein